MTKFLKNILFSSIFLTSILPIAALVSCEDKVPAKKKMTANFDAIKSNISLNSNETVGAIDLSNAVFKVNEVSIKVSNLSAEYSITKLVGSTFDFPSIIFDFIGDTPKIYWDVPVGTSELSFDVVFTYENGDDSFQVSKIFSFTREESNILITGKYNGVINSFEWSGYTYSEGKVSFTLTNYFLYINELKINGSTDVSGILVHLKAAKLMNTSPGAPTADLLKNIDVDAEFDKASSEPNKNQLKFSFEYDEANKEKILSSSESPLMFSFWIEFFYNDEIHKVVGNSLISFFEA